MFISFQGHSYRASEGEGGGRERERVRERGREREGREGGGLEILSRDNRYTVQRGMFCL